MFLCLLKGTYATIETTGETTVQSTQEEDIYDDIDANITETRHASVSVCTIQNI